MATFNKYRASLDSCRKLAKDEYEFVTHAFKDCDELVQRLEHSYAVVINRIPKSRSPEARAGLEQLREELKNKYAAKRAARSDNLRAKAEQHRFFNVMLFGRTMAGKSTLREALTGGDGSSIGKGAQRTTLDVKEYEWNGLRIVDTPGFGAVEGAQDTEKARKTLERIDLVLFLLNSDSIQDTTFRELEYIAERNTPLIFVLNMKRNLENEGNLRRALKSPEKFIYKPDEITGHEERLRFLASQAGLNPGLVRVIPIHAQAAFMSTQATGFEAEEFRNLGRLDHLLATICQEVETNGPIRRIQSFLDAALLHVTQQLSLFIEQRDRLGTLKLECTSGSDRIATWRKQLTSASPRKVSAAVDRIYKKLEDSIPDFVDDNVESRNAADIWKERVERLQVHKSIESAAQELADEVKQGLIDLSSEMNESLHFAASLAAAPEMKGFDEWDYKRIHGWGSAISGVLGKVAYIMSWNIVGWVAVGLTLGFSIFSRFSDSRNSKLSAAKQKMEQELRKAVEKTKQETKKTLATWIRDKLLDGVVAASETRLNAIAGGIQEFEDALGEALRHIDEVQTIINIRLLQRVASVITGRNNSLPPASRLVRMPGYASYLLTKERFWDIELLKQMGSVLNERIEVIQETSKQEVLSYLFRGLVQHVEVRSPKLAILHAAEADIGKIKGNGRRRIRLAAALAACELRTQTIKGNTHA
jgi:small GTP-binding protein